MSPPQRQADLFGAAQVSPAPGTVAINARCTLRTQDGHRVVLVVGVPIAHFAVGDRAAETYAMVTLVEQGWAEQLEVARAFGCSTRTVRRSQRLVAQGGRAAAGRTAGWPRC